MALTKVLDLDCDKTVAIGGKDGEGVSNPTSVKGYYLGYRTVETDFGPAKLHIFQTSSGNVGVWGKTDLDRKLSSVDKGNYAEVTFAGMKAATKKGRKPSYKYDVAQDPDNAIDVTMLADANEASQESDDYVASAETDEVDDAEYAESEADAEDAFQDEPPPVKSSAPRQAAKAPDAARQAKVAAMLSGRKSAKAS